MQLVVAKLNQTFSIPDRDKMPKASVEFLLAYGVKQYVNDGHASVLRKNYTGPNAESQWRAACVEAVNDRIDNIKTGNFARKAREISAETVGSNPDLMLAGLAHMATNNPDAFAKILAEAAKKKAA